MRRQTVVWLLVLALVAVVRANDVLDNPFLKSEVTHLATGVSIKRATAEPIHPSFLESRSAASASSGSSSQASSYAAHLAQLRESVIAKSRAEIEQAAENEFQAEMARVREEARQLALRRGGPTAAAAPAPVAAAAAQPQPQLKQQQQPQPQRSSSSPLGRAPPNAFSKKIEKIASAAAAAASASKAAQAAASQSKQAKPAAATGRNFRFQAFPPSSSFIATSTRVTTESSASASSPAAPSAEEHDDFARALAEAEEALLAARASDAAPAAASDAGSSLLEVDADDELASASADDFFRAWVEHDASGSADDAIAAAEEVFGGSLIETAAATTTSSASKGANAGYGYSLNLRPASAPNGSTPSSTVSTGRGEGSRRASSLAARHGREQIPNLNDINNMGESSSFLEYSSSSSASSHLAHTARARVRASARASMGTPVSPSGAADPTAAVMSPQMTAPAPDWPYVAPTLPAPAMGSYVVAPEVTRRWGTFAGSRGYDLKLRPGTLEARATGPLGGGLPREELYEAATGAVADSDYLVGPAASVRGAGSPFAAFTDAAAAASGSLGGSQLNIPSGERQTAAVFPTVPPPPLAPNEMPAPAAAIMAQGTPAEYSVAAQPALSVGPAISLLGLTGPPRDPRAAYYPSGPTLSFANSGAGMGGTLSGAAGPPLGIPAARGLLGPGNGGGMGAGAGNGWGSMGPVGPATIAAPSPAGGLGAGAFAWNNIGDPVRPPLAVLLSAQGQSAAAAAAWSGVKADTTLREVQYPGDTPFLPADAIGPNGEDALPPAAIEQPVPMNPTGAGPMAALGLPMGGYLT